jgi:K+-transporting ATPase ATPase C chain
MLNQLRPALVMTAIFTLLTGLAYPLAMTGLAQSLFPFQANGSLVQRDGHVVGSALVGQAFAGERYFQPRASAAGAGYDAGASSGSNLGPLSEKLATRMRDDAARVRANFDNAPIPADAVTASASGLDPDISPANARAQVARVAAARGLAIGNVAALVEAQIQKPLLGFIGAPRVNVLALNLALDDLKP